MADQPHAPPNGSQCTGNPVLDTMANIVRGPVSVSYLKELHTFLLECAQKEPGGLRRPAGTSEASAEKKPPVTLTDLKK